MRNSNRDNRSRGARSGSRFGPYDSGSSVMYPAICANCGKSCEVPFKPRGDRPIYCSSCFDKSASRDSRRPEGRGERSRFEEKRMFEATCDDCRNKCEVPFKPTAGKPIYCKECFEKHRSKNIGGSAGSNKQLGEQFAILNSKLDKILSALTSQLTKESISLVVPAKKAKKIAKQNSAKAGKKIVKKKVAK